MNRIKDSTLYAIEKILSWRAWRLGGSKNHAYPVNLVRKGEKVV